jgi:alkylation response protein AidB-like acyl-CoA dehydrogenase
MNFAFDEEQISLGDTVARLLADHSGLLIPEPPAAAQAAAWNALADLGLFALVVPAEFGGAGLSLVDIALAVEALGAGLAPPAAAATLIAADVLARHGSAAQQQTWMPRIVAGEAMFAFAVLEAGQGYDPADVACTFHGGVLTGSKILVSQAADADVLMVVAATEAGPALVLVPRDAPGVSLRPHEDIDPSSAFCEATFAAVPLDEAAVLGEGSVARLFDVGATIYAGMQTGIASRMMEAAVEFAKTRSQFGHPIGAFQAIKHRCADMAVSLEAARSAEYYAFWAVAEGAPDRARAASMAKSYCGEVVRSICNEVIQVHGGMGFTWELGLHRFLRRARVLEHSFGDGAFHNERVVAETIADLSRTHGLSAVR